MAEAKAKKSKSNIKELSYSELIAKRDEMKKKYMDLRFKMVISRQKELAGENK